jgi:hypothetical protein
VVVTFHAATLASGRELPLTRAELSSAESRQLAWRTVVEAFDEAESNFVLRLTVGGDTVPMTINHLGKLLMGSRRCQRSWAFQLSKNLRAQASEL